jgi:hypothetical protein
MSRRLAIARLPVGSVPADEGEPISIDPPALLGIRLVFGVGSAPDHEPDAEGFIPVYTVEIPVVSQGGLDHDDIYEFDAGAQLELLRSRATRRRWAVRLELEFVQVAASVAAADLWLECDWSSEGPQLVQLGAEQGRATPGGGRALTIASTPVGEVDRARALGGRFVACLRDADPRTPRARIESPPLHFELSMRHYEFEPED